MKRFYFISIAVIFSAVFFISCDKNNENTDQTSLTKEEERQIINSYNDINDLAGAVLLGEGEIAIDGLEELAVKCQDYPMIEDAWVDGKTLMVKFLKGGTISWIITSDIIIPPYQSELPSSQSSLRSSTVLNKPSNNKVCLINQQYNDAGRQYCKDIISNLNSQLQQNDYVVTIKNGSAANVDFFQNNLNQYGVVFCINHGCYDSQKDITWLLTGEESDTLKINSPTFYQLWVDNKVSIGTVYEVRNGEKKAVSYLMISDRFLNSEYAQNSFPNSLIYWVACESMKSSKLGQTLNSKGVGVTIGWDETNCRGQSTGALLFKSLLGGYNVKDAFQVLPTEAREDYCSVSSGANLVYYPNGGGNMYLVDTTKTSITLFSPLDRQIYEERVLNLLGIGNGFKKITEGTVEVNGIATTLVLVNDTTFSQPIEINKGENHIKINCYGKLENGKSSFTSTELTVSGDFPTLALYTQLRWNTNYTDVDFHLLPPNTTISDLWSYTDCYYSNMQTYWGGYLDVDDVDGYGPEHITIPENPIPGKYTLYVHYYYDHEMGASDAFVDVSAYDGNIIKFGPYKLNNSGGDNAGDLWEVCTIEYPSGIITPINKYYYLGTGMRSAELKMKKK